MAERLGRREPTVRRAHDHVDQAVGQRVEGDQTELAAGKVNFLQILDLIHEGFALPPEEPGLGIEWNWDAIEERRVGGTTLVVD